MANLTSGSILTGNIISSSDITTLYDVFTGAQTYDNINIPTGSIFNSTSASYATSASQAENSVNSNKVTLTGDTTNANRFIPFTAISAGNSGLLTDAGFLYNPSTNALQVDTLLVSTLSSTTLSGSLSVSGSTTLSGSLGVSGSTTLSGSLSISGSTTLSGSLSISGSLTATGGFTGSFSGSVTGSSTSASIALGLDDFNSTNRNGDALVIGQPKPLVASIPISPSGALDLSTIGVGSGATDIGTHIWFNVSYSPRTFELDSAADLAVTWSAPTLEITGSSGLSGVAIVTGWYSGSIV